MLIKSQTIDAALGVNRQSLSDVERHDCFNQLLKRFHGQALSTAWRLLGHHQEHAEDVVQTAFQKAWENFEDLEKPERLKSWFFQILVNECRNLQRRYKTRKVLRQIFMPWEQTGEMPSHGDHGIQKRIHLAMKKLSPRQREAFVLVHLEGFSHIEAAAMMNTSTGTLKSHLHRGTQSLRHELHDIRPNPKEVM